MVGDVVCVLSCEVLIFFPNCFWDAPLQCLQPIWRAIIKRCFASLFQTAIISLLQVWLEKLHCTPFHKVGIACASFVLGMKPSVVQYFGLSRTNALLALILLFSHLGRNKKVAVGSLLHTADRRECCLSIPDARLAMST